MKQSWWITFAANNKLRLTKDSCDEMIAKGKLGILYEYDEEQIGAMYIPKVPRKGWKIFKETMLEVGAIVVQNGDLEGAVIFEANNGKALRTACKLLKVPNKRTLSPERRAAAVAALAAYRQSL